MPSKFHINPATGNPNKCDAKIKCRFGGETGLENHYDTPDQARKAYQDSMKIHTVPEPVVSFPDKTGREDMPLLQSLTPRQVTEMVTTASAQYGQAMRTYVRLLQHCDYEMAKGLRGRVKDSKAIDLAIAYSKAKTDVSQKTIAVSKTQDRLDNAKTPEQRKAYYANLLEEKAKKDAAVSTLNRVSYEVKNHRKIYEDKVEEHEQTIERLRFYQNEAQNGVVTPAPLARSLEQLPKNSKSILEGEQLAKYESMLVEFNTFDKDKVISAAESSGNKFYVESAKSWKEHSIKVERASARFSEFRTMVYELEEKAKAGEFIDEKELNRLQKQQENASDSASNERLLVMMAERRLNLFRSDINDNIKFYKRAAEEIQEIVEYGE